MFPRQNSGADRIPGYTKIEMIGQRDFTGVVFEYTLRKLYELPPLIVKAPGARGWGSRFTKLEDLDIRARRKLSELPYMPGYVCNPRLPAGSYQLWEVTITTDDVSMSRFRPYQIWYAIPHEHGHELSPDGICSYISEFWATSPENFERIYLWDHEVLNAPSQYWMPIRYWEFYYDPLGESGVPNIGYGARKVIYNNRPAIEYSNDRTDRYMKYKEKFWV
jgi:hypothetical protein